MQKRLFLHAPGLLELPPVLRQQRLLPALLQKRVHGPQGVHALLLPDAAPALDHPGHQVHGAPGVLEHVHHQAHRAVDKPAVEHHLAGPAAGNAFGLGPQSGQGPLPGGLGLLAHRPPEAGGQHHAPRPLQHRARQAAPLKGRLRKGAQGGLSRLRRVFPLLRTPLQLSGPPAARLFEGGLKGLRHMPEGVPVLKVLRPRRPGQLPPDAAGGDRLRRDALPPSEIDPGHGKHPRQALRPSISSMLCTMCQASSGRTMKYVAWMRWPRMA